MTKAEILIKLKEEFIKEDKAEPFQNREYVEETIRLFNLLLGGFDDTENQTDNALYDIVSDIFGYYGNEDDLNLLIRDKLKLIKTGKGAKNGN